MQLLIVAILIFIVGSLGHALFSMAAGPDTSGRVVKALTVRVALSLLLFASLYASWHFGLIEPHRLQ